MVIRKLRQKKIVSTKILFRFLLICFGVFFLIKLVNGIAQRYAGTPQENMLTLGATLTFSGKIAVDNKFPNYTHSIMDPTGKKIGLKSSTINLNSYINKKIELVGRVKKYFTTIPVIEVDTIKIPDQSILITNNRYLFAKDLIYLDFSSQPQLSAIRSGNDIQVWFDKIPVVNIERFLCSKILKSQNCTYLITDYIQNNKDNFQSYRGYSFYKHGTGFRTTFDDNTFGFMFKDISDDMILDISNMFQIVNKDFIVSNKLNLIQSNCKSDFSQLRSVDTTDAAVSYKDPYLLTLSIKGTDKKKNPVSCRITFDIRNGWNVTDAQYN